MSFPAYPAYKDSGIAWLGEVPSHWEVGGLKRYVAIIGGSTPKSEIEDYWDGSIPWVTPADLSRLSDFWISDTLRKITPAGLASCGTTLVPAGSVILSTRAPIGSLGIAKVELCTNQGCKALVPSRIDEKFLAYLLSISSDELNVRGRGSTFLELSADELGAFRIAFPPPTEQQSIAAFLDRETAKIDALVAEQERLIALLREKRQAVISHAVTKGLNPDTPMKDSGIEWLGAIPAHWTSVKLGRASFMQEGPGLRTWQFTAEGTRVICVTNITDAGIDFSRLEKFISTEEYQRAYQNFTVDSGDVLLSSSGNSWGKVAVYDGDEKVILNTSTIRLRQSEEAGLTNQYIAFLLQSDAVRDQLELAMTGACQPNFGPTHLNSVMIALPSTNDQDAIVDFLSAACSKLESLIAEAQSAITLLQERRAALISAAVTGKIDVREVVSESNVVSIDSARPSNLPPLRAVVGAYAIRELGSMGRMAVMKVGYLAEGHTGFSDLNGRYERFAAGPYDSSLIAAMERGAGEICAIVTNEPQDEGKPVTYDIPKGCQPPSDALSALVGEDRAQRFLALLSLLKGIGRDGVEAAATLYAVWNDLLAAGKVADDDAICNGVLNDWHPEKAKKFKRADLDHWLAWMRRNGLVPDGSAPRTDNQGDLFA